MKKYFTIALALVVPTLAGVLFLGTIPVAKANPLYLIPGFSTVGTQASNSTSTVAFIRAGQATTTIYLDAFAGGSTYAFNNASVSIVFHASSTAAKLNWRYEFSPGNAGIDCTANPTQCDWYGNSITTDQAATTTAQNIENYNEHSWTFASSTLGSSQSSLANGDSTALKTVAVQVPLRYVRAVFYVPPGAGNAGIWAQLWGQQEAP